LAGYRKADVERLIDALVEHGLLLRDEEDEYRRLYLTEGGVAAVRNGNADVEWRLASPAASKSEAGRPSPKNNAVAGDADPALLADLKEWRGKTAMAENIPAYVVFADKTLIAIAAAKPANEFDLLNLNGIGPAKAAKYGEIVLEIVRKHSQEEFG
jgi:superfamily II DNA helicase RecQ